MKSLNLIIFLQFFLIICAFCVRGYVPIKPTPRLIHQEELSSPQQKIKKRPGVGLFPDDGAKDNDQLSIENSIEDDSNHISSIPISDSKPISARKGVGSPPPLAAAPEETTSLPITVASSPSINETNNGKKDVSSNAAFKELKSDEDSKKSLIDKKVNSNIKSVSNKTNVKQIKSHVDSKKKFVDTKLNSKIDSVSNKSNTINQTDSTDNDSALNKTNINNDHNINISSTKETTNISKAEDIIKTTESNIDFTKPGTQFEDKYQSVESNYSLDATTRKNNLTLTNLNILGKPSIASVHNGNRASSSTTIVLSILVAIAICGVIGLLTYKKLHAYWSRRHYSRVDYLIDGLYEM